MGNSSETTARRSGSACGKVILLGEHSVVYGKPALAAGLARGAEAHFTPAPSPSGDAASPALALTVTSSLAGSAPAVFHPGDGTDLGRALEALSRALPDGAHARRAGVIDATLHLPGGGGLGSSAALGIAVARALCERALTVEETLAAGLAWEQVFHGNPSGVDHTMATLGGAGVYTRGEGVRPVRLRAPLRLLLADTGERTPTKETVGSVARQYARRPEALEQTFEAIAALVRNATLALEANDTRALGQLMDMNQALLSSLLLSTERTEQLCSAARSAGALGAKLTGGGGGGCVLALCPGDDPATTARVRAALEALGAPVWDATIAPSDEPAIERLEREVTR